MKKSKVVPSDIANLRGADTRFAGWRKALASNPSGNCVEVGTGRGEYAGFVGVRDSKNPDGPVLAFTPAEWEAFVDGVKKDEFTAR
jgi:hypothetical protein